MQHMEKRRHFPKRTRWGGIFCGFAKSTGSTISLRSFERWRLIVTSVLNRAKNKYNTSADLRPELAAQLPSAPSLQPSHRRRIKNLRRQQYRWFSVNCCPRLCLPYTPTLGTLQDIG